MTPRYHFYYRFFNRSLCHVHDSIYHRWTCSPVTVRIRFGLMNLFRPKSSQGIILLSICWLTPTVSSLKEYRAKKIVSWSLLLLFVLETITDYRPFRKIVKKILCTKLYTEYLQHRRMFTWNIRHCYIKLLLFNDFFEKFFLIFNRSILWIARCAGICEEKNHTFQGGVFRIDDTV